MHYLEFIRNLHVLLEPKTYFEIGVRNGASITLSGCKSIGVDPAYDIKNPLPADTQLFRQKSDDFFATDALEKALGPDKIDLAFIDGWHNFEFALRDFLNTEQHCGGRSVIVVDDVRPRNEDEAVRIPHGRAWTGDVWKVSPCLQKYRPDLRLTHIGTIPTGLLMIEALDPLSRKLRNSMAEIESVYLDPDYPLMPPADFLARFVTPAKALADLIARRATVVQEEADSGTVGKPNLRSNPT